MLDGVLAYCCVFHVAAFNYCYGSLVACVWSLGVMTITAEIEQLKYLYHEPFYAGNFGDSV